MRILEPAPGILAFYDGRVEGHRFAAQDNWVDDGALSLGIASYAILSGDEALIYDTHVSLAHAAAIRNALTARGVTRMRVVLSHWHLDHVAGTAAFPGIEVIANARTLAHLTEHQAAIEAGTDHGWPPINPLILPDTTFSGQMRLQVGTRTVILIEANIHSDDATVLWLPDARILLAGDTVEDCVTYVGAPADFDVHLADLDRLMALRPNCVLPCHGDPEVIAAGGYSVGLLEATAHYIQWLQKLRQSPQLCATPMDDVIAADLKRETLRYFAPYNRVHVQNVERTLAFFQGMDKAAV